MFLLMPHSGRWFAADRRSALISFLIPALMIVYATLGTYTNVLADMGLFTWLLAYGLIISGFKLVLFLWMVRMIAKLAGVLDHYWHFVHANNWVIFVSCICLTPAVWVMNHAPAGEAGFPYFICGLLYSYMVASVSAVRILRLSWEQCMLITVASIIANGIIFLPFHRVGGLIIL
ncbi:MAG: hypothetical protein ACXW30_01840 [Micavibrio sp.]